MGIFSFIRRALTNDIVLNEDISKDILHFIKLKKKRIKIDSKVTIQNGHIFAVGHRGKALDFLPVGTHYLSAVTLPACSKKFKLYKLDSNGKKKKYFKAETYFINLSTFDATFTTDKVELKDEKYGVFTAQYSGKYNFTVTDYKKTFATLYGLNSCKKPLKDFEILKKLASEYLSEILAKANFSVDDNKEYSQKLRTFTSENFQKKIFDFGLVLNSFEITDIIFNKSLMKKLNCDTIKFVNENGEEVFDNNKYNNAFHFPETDTIQKEKEEKIESLESESNKKDQNNNIFGLWENSLTQSEEEKLKKFEPCPPAKPKQYAYEKFTQTKQEEKDILEKRKAEGMFTMFGNAPSTYMQDTNKKVEKTAKVIKAEKSIEFALFGQGEKAEEPEETDKRATSKSFVNLSLHDNPLFSSQKKKETKVDVEILNKTDENNVDE